MSDEKAVSYDESPVPGWAPAVNGWTWHPADTSHGKAIGWWKSGACPRCHDQIEITIGLVESFLEEVRPQVYAQCNCRVAHAAGQVGCGASAEVNGPTRG